MSTPTREQVDAALARVNDPEIKRPITELGMVDTVEIADDGTVAVRVLLTVAGCPLKDTINRDVTAAVSAVPGVTSVELELGVMSAEQRAGLQEVLRGGQAQREIPFAQPGSLTKVYAIASGKGGVGKSSVTVNLALALAKQGLKVGIVDADIYGHSVPAMLGVADSRPTQVEDLIMPVPTPSGVSVIPRLKAMPENTSQTALPENAANAASNGITRRSGNRTSTRREVYSMGTGSNVQNRTANADSARASRAGRPRPPGYRRMIRGASRPRTRPAVCFRDMCSLLQTCCKPSCF